MRLRLALPSRDWLPIGLSQAVAVGCGLGGIHLTSHWVRPEDMGAYGLFLSLVPLATTLTHAGLIRHFARHWTGAADQAGYLRSWARASLGPTAGLLALVLAATAMGIVHPSGAWGATTLFLAAAAGTYGQAFQLGVQSAARYWTDFGLTLFGSGTRTFLPLLLAAGTGAGLLALTGGYAFHAVTFALLAVAVITRPAEAPAGPAHAGEAPAPLQLYQRLFLLNGALTLLNQGVVRWTAGLVLDSATLGQVTLAANLAAVGPSIASGALWQFSYPRLLHWHRRTAHQELQRQADRTFVVYLAACAVGGLALAGLLPLISGNLLSETYLPAGPFVLPLFAFYTGLCGLTLLQGELLVLDRPAAALRFSAMGTALMAGGTLVCGATAPAQLAAWWLVSPFASLPLLWLELRRIRPRASAPAA